MPDIWETAKGIEQEGERFYRKLSKEAGSRELAGVFTVLAGEERRHYDLFVQLQKGAPVEAGAGADVATEVVEALRKLTADFVAGEKAGDTEAAYRKALALEQRSVEHYESMLGGLSGPAQVSAVKTIIAEEKRHAAIVESLIQYVRRPKEWVENAEFARLGGEEY